MTVPVNVPLISAEGSTESVSVIPSGGMMPLVGTTESHGLSVVATNDVGPEGRPGIRIGKTTGVVLPTGTLMLILMSPTFGSGTMTTLSIGEKRLAWPQARARTR